MPAPSKIATAKLTPVARRIAKYVNEKFDGNMSAAAEALGCTFDVVFRQATGRSRPSLALLNLLAQHSGQPLDWWVHGDENQ